MAVKLSKEDFALRARLGPLPAIDLILRDPDGAALLGLRNNEPAKGYWFVPGGVIYKDEPLAEAFGRILAAETGLAVPFSKAKLLGAYEHFYTTNTLGLPGFGTHYVTLGYELSLDHRPAIVGDDQHEQMRWMLPAEILAAPDVQDNTKAYFR